MGQGSGEEWSVLRKVSLILLFKYGPQTATSASPESLKKCRITGPTQIFCVIICILSRSLNDSYAHPSLSQETNRFGNIEAIGDLDRAVSVGHKAEAILEPDKE